MNKSEGISSKTIGLLNKLGITKLRPLQQSTFNSILACKHVLAQGFKGSGRTLAYILPLIEKCRQEITLNQPLVIVLQPTNELTKLAVKLLEPILNRCEMTISCLQDNIESHINKSTVILGTAEKILQHLNKINLTKVKTLVGEINEVHGNIDKVFDEINKRVKNLQCIIFTTEITESILNLAKKYFKPDYKVIGKVEHLGITDYSKANIKDAVLTFSKSNEKTIVFTSTKEEADYLSLCKNAQVLPLNATLQQKTTAFHNLKQGILLIIDNTVKSKKTEDNEDDEWLGEVDLIVQCRTPKNIEIYIKRALKTHTIITFFNKTDNLIQEIQSIGVNLTIIEDLNKDLLNTLKKVDMRYLDKYQYIARALIKEYGRDNALLVALSFITSGGPINKPNARSILNNTEGMITFAIETDNELRSRHYVWSILRRLLPVIDTSQIKHIIPYNNHRGAVFDVPESAASRLEAAYKSEKEKNSRMDYCIKEIKELPELEEEYVKGNNNM